MPGRIYLPSHSCASDNWEKAGIGCLRGGIPGCFVEIAGRAWSNYTFGNNYQHQPPAARRGALAAPLSFVISTPITRQCQAIGRRSPSKGEAKRALHGLWGYPLMEMKVIRRHIKDSQRPFGFGVDVLSLAMGSCCSAECFQIWCLLAYNRNSLTRGFNGLVPACPQSENNTGTDSARKSNGSPAPLSGNSFSPTVLGEYRAVKAKRRAWLTTQQHEHAVPGTGN